VESLSKNDAVTQPEGGTVYSIEGVPGGWKPTSPAQRGNVTERIIEFVGKEGRPYLELLKFVVRDLKLLKPEGLLRELFEKGVLVKVPREDGQLWVALGSP
jgi:hypothetical protein